MSGSSFGQTFENIDDISDSVFDVLGKFIVKK